MAYCISSYRRLCSSTFPGSVVKRASNVTMRERRSSILFPTAIVPCRCVCQKRTSSMESQANFRISIKGGDEPLALKFESAPPRKGECIFVVKSRQRDRLGPPDTPLSHLVSDTGSANHTINARFFRRVKFG